MAETSSSNTSPPATLEVHTPSHPRQSAPPADVRGPLPHGNDDPVTDWLLEQRDLDTTEFAVLFAIHKLNVRRRRSGWIQRSELCRSTGLDPVSLTRVLTSLRAAGRVGMSRHPVDNARARYLLMAG